MIDEDADRLAERASFELRIAELRTELRATFSALDGISAQLKRIADALEKAGKGAEETPEIEAAATLPLSDATFYAAEHPTFAVTMTKVGNNRLGVMKAFGRVLGSDRLKHVDPGFLQGEVPKLIKAGISQVEAEAVKEQFEAAGATVTIRAEQRVSDMEP
jgi:ribosomal protein L7/L12